MCDKTELVPIPDLLWDRGGIYQFDSAHPEYGLDEQGRKCLALDACIVPAVKALWSAGIVTMSCCCGHGDSWGVITIQTETIAGRKGAMVIGVEKYDELTAIAQAARAYRAAYHGEPYTDAMQENDERAALSALFASIDAAEGVTDGRAL